MANTKGTPGPWKIKHSESKKAIFDMLPKVQTQSNGLRLNKPSTKQLLNLA